MASGSGDSASFLTETKRYSQTLSSALSSFISLSQPSTKWKPLHSATTSSSNSTSTAGGAGAGGSSTSTTSATRGRDLLNGIGPVDLSSVQVHKRPGKNADVVRATVDVAIGDNFQLDVFEAVLKTPEVRSTWDKLVEHAHVLELLDPQTRITKTDYRIGWPASPRDTVTVNRIYRSSSALHSIAASLPRSPDEPSFLRPAPPYVRSHVHLLSFSVVPSPTSKTARITLLWEWSLKGAVFTTHHGQLASLLASFVDFARAKGDHIPLVLGWGNGIELSQSTFDRAGELAQVEYAVMKEDDPTDPSAADGSTPSTLSSTETGIDFLERRKERRRLASSVEFALSSRQGWDVKVSVKPVGDNIDTTWQSSLEAVSGSAESEARLVFRLTHVAIEKPDLLARVSVTLQRLAGGKLVKINGEPANVVTIEPRNPSSYSRLLESDASSISASSFTSTRTSSTTSSSVTTIPTIAVPAISATTGEILSLLRRNYIYFTSLLQEPEAKWRHVNDSHGVTVTQLNSIDPTLTIYRAEATFVGVGVWDVFSTICTPGARAQWDKTMEDAILLDDVNELSSLWHVKTKAAWPVAPRDSVTIRTAYKSPSSVHIFSFSTDDTYLFPSIPPIVPPTIRTQTDLYGWAIEALSPTTTQITLLDQSDPKGWSNKSWTPTQMVNAVAGVRDFSIKFGGPPVITRLHGAKATFSKYDHVKGTLKSEYKASPEDAPVPTFALPNRWSTDDLGSTPSPSPFALKSKNSTNGNQSSSPASHMIECEIRCDITTWASSIDIVIDPPPAKISCLNRHRLSSGGGLWITIEHDPSVVEKDRILVLIRRGGGGPSREKGSVSVNGAKVNVDVESLPEDEVKLLAKRKRVKASPIPLDQYSTHGPRSSWSGTSSSASPSGRAGIKHSASDSVKSTSTSSSGKSDSTAIAAAGTTLSVSSSNQESSSGSSPSSTASPLPSSSGPSSSSPLSQAPLTGSSSRSSPGTPGSLAFPKPKLPPPAQALEALSMLQTFHAEQGPELTDPAPGWAIVSERTGAVVRKKLIPRISESLYVYRGDKIVQGLTADEIASVVSSVGCRKAWDERIESAIQLSSYGLGCSTSVLTTKPTFPFKGRIFHVASVNAHCRVPSASAATSTSTVLFYASASFSPDETFDTSKLNPSSLLPAQIYLEGWILETLDPYTSSMLAIPSTRLTYVACVDQAGSTPLAQSVLNVNIARLIASVEQLGKAKGPIPRLWSPESSLQIEGPLNDDPDQECVWKLGTETNATSVLVTADFFVEDGTFFSIFRASAPPSWSSIVGGSLPALNGPSTNPSSTSGSTMANGSASKEDTAQEGGLASLIKSELPRSASLSSFASNSCSAVLARPKSNGDLRHKSSKSSLRLSSSSTAVPPLPSSSSSTSAIAATTKRSLSPSFRADPSSASSDLVVAELIVDLKQFPHGYSLMCSSSLPSAEEGKPLSIEALRSLAARQIPIYATAHEAPLPSIVSASLDSSKRRNHLVRFLVPTSSITNPVQDPLRDPKSVKPAPPEWFKQLVKSPSGALVEVRIVPLPPDSSSSASALSSPGSTRVMFNGERLSLHAQRDSRAIWSAMEDEDWRSSGVKISRVPQKRKAAFDSSLPSFPTALEEPVAVATRLLTPLKPDPSSIDDFEFPDPKSPGSVTPNPDERDGTKSPAMVTKAPPSPVMTRQEHSNSDASTSGQFFQMLGAYPLSRLSSGISTSVVGGTSSSGTGAGGGATVTDGGGGSVRGGNVRRTYSLSFVLIAVLISFLLGSLLRSLLTPADYIIYGNHHEGETKQMERVLMQAFDPDRRWREARRLLEIRSFFFSKWDFIVAVVRRN